MLGTTCSGTSDSLFSTGTTLGVFLAFEASLLSGISVSAVLCYTIYKILKKIYARQIYCKSNRHVALPPIDATDSLGFVTLMLAELIKSFGGMLSIRWVVEGCITQGPLCEAQGYLRQIGDVGVGLFSLFIGFDTFFVIVFGWRASRVINFGALMSIWLFIVLVVSLGTGLSQKQDAPYMGSTGYWCWIQEKNNWDFRVWLEYFWMWISAIMLMVIYGLIALVIHGYLIVEGSQFRFKAKGKTRIKLDPKDHIAGDSEDERENRVIANIMLFYPAVYTICVLPHSIVRWINFADEKVTSGPILVVTCIFELSGFFNVLLFKLTRPALVSGKNLDPHLLSDGQVATWHTNAPPDRESKPSAMGMLPEDDEQSTPPSGSTAKGELSFEEDVAEANSDIITSDRAEPTSSQSFNVGTSKGKALQVLT